MNTQVDFDKCLTFINSQLQPADERDSSLAGSVAKRAVTISRQSGSGARVVAQKLAQYLQDHHLPERLAKYMPEDRITEFTDTLEELFGLHPQSWTLVKRTSETILRLAELGNTVLLGRGAGVVTAHLPHVFRVRLVAPLDKRVAYLQQVENLDHETARNRIRQEDLGRKRYFRKYFGMDDDDPLLYHLILNTDSVSPDEATRLIGEAVLHRDTGRLTPERRSAVVA